MNAIGYTRLSARDQSRYSLDDQERSIKSYCRSNNIDLLALFKDNGECSDTFDRADFRALEQFIKEHKGSVRYLIVMDHDRFSRDLSEALLKIKQFERSYRIKVLSIDEPLDLDINDPDVFLSRAFKYLMANQELLRIRKRTRRGIRSALEAGRFVNKAPFGYLNTRDASGKATLTVDTERAFLIEKIFRDYLAGIPQFLIYREVRKIGFTRTGKSAILNVLNNSVYAGLIKVPALGNIPEKYVKAVHEAIVSESDFWLAQRMLANNKPVKTQPKEEFPLRGVLKCYCGRHMTAGWSKGKRKYYLYYRCTYHHDKNIPGGWLHDQMDEILKLLCFKQEQVDYLLLQTERKLKESLKLDSLEKQKMEKGLASMEKKIEKLEERLMNDEIGGDTYKRWYRKYAEDKAAIETALNRLGQREKEKWQKAKKALPQLASLHQIYQRANLKQKHQLLKGVFKGGLAFYDGKLRTPSVNPVFSHNLLKIKEKGLLDIEQPSSILGENPVSTQGRGRTGTILLSLVFETNASTNSATWACPCWDCKSRITLDIRQTKFKKNYS